MTSSTSMRSACELIVQSQLGFPNFQTLVGLEAEDRAEALDALEGCVRNV